jgi:hypothetical protein
VPTTGRCLKWLDETGEGWAKACLDGELARACARKSGPKDEEIAAMERPKGAVVTTKARRSALHLPSKRGDQLKAQLARRREDAGAWLFESMNQNLRTTSQHVIRGLDPRIHHCSQESFEEDGLPGQARQ